MGIYLISRARQGRNQQQQNRGYFMPYIVTNVIIKCARCQSHLETEVIHDDNEDTIILVSGCKTCKSERDLESIEEAIAHE